MTNCSNSAAPPTDQHSASTSNHLYIKSVSPLATEQSVTEFLRQARLSLPFGDYERRARDDEDLSLAATERREAENKRNTDQQTVADDIESIIFIQYPGSSLRYCQISFKSSAGVTSAMSLNGHLLLGVPTSLSVIDPAKLDLLAAAPSDMSNLLFSGSLANGSLSGQNVLVQALSPTTIQCLIKETQAVHTGGQVSHAVQALRSLFLSVGCLTAEQANGLVACASAAASAAEEGGLGISATQANVLAAIAKAAGAMTGGSIDVIAKMASAHLPRETEEDQIARTLFIKCVPDPWGEEQLINFLVEILALGTIRDKKLDILPSTGKRFALIEFAQSQAVEYACQLDEERRTVCCEENKDNDDLQTNRSRKFILEFEPAKTTVRPREPDHVSFNLNQAVLPPVPIAYQSVNQLTLDQKLQEARARAAKLVALRNANKDSAEKSHTSTEKGNSDSGDQSYSEVGNSRRPHEEQDFYSSRSGHSHGRSDSMRSSSRHSREASGHRRNGREYREEDSYSGGGGGRPRYQTLGHEPDRRRHWSRDRDRYYKDREHYRSEPYNHRSNHRRSSSEEYESPRRSRSSRQR